MRIYTFNNRAVPVTVPLYRGEMFQIWDSPGYSLQSEAGGQMEHLNGQQ